jgi:hypothetical protein
LENVKLTWRKSSKTRGQEGFKAGWVVGTLASLNHFCWFTSTDLCTSSGLCISFSVCLPWQVGKDAVLLENWKARETCRDTIEGVSTVSRSRARQLIWEVLWQLLPVVIEREQLWTIHKQLIVDVVRYRFIHSHWNLNFFFICLLETESHYLTQANL